jgi:hypothetical protein
LVWSAASAGGESVEIKVGFGPLQAQRVQVYKTDNRSFLFTQLATSSQKKTCHTSRKKQNNILYQPIREVAQPELENLIVFYVFLLFYK